MLKHREDYPKVLGTLFVFMLKHFFLIRLALCSHACLYIIVSPVKSQLQVISRLDFETVRLLVGYSLGYPSSFLYLFV